MEAFLLTWNPTRFNWTDFDQAVARVRTEGTLRLPWSCGNTRRIREGDRVFLVRQGRTDPGVIGSGWASSRPYAEAHWADRGAERTKRAWYIETDWDWLSREPVIPRTRLERAPFVGVNWSSQSSGITIPPAIAELLETAFEELTGIAPCPLPEEFETQQLPEGSTRTVTIDRFERDGRLRQECLNHHGFTCVVCRVLLSNVYGAVAERFIHVHHLQPLAAIRRRHLVDPVKDLRPVCPNCHAIIHRRSPPYSIEEVAGMLGNWQAGVDAVRPA